MKEGVGNVAEMRRHLKHFAKNDLFGNGNLPVKSNKRYFPRPKTIRNHIVRATRKLRRSLIDQECLVDKIEQWKQDQKETNIYFRPKKKLKVTKKCMNCQTAMKMVGILSPCTKNTCTLIMPM